MANSRPTWALLVAVLALPTVERGNLGAEQLSSAVQVEPSRVIESDPGYLPGEGGYVAAGGGPFYSGAASYPPVRFVSYPKAATSLWYCMADAVAMKRDAHGNRSFAALLVDHDGDPATDLVPRSVLGTQNLDFEFPAGLRVLVGRRLGDWYGIEASYFGLFNSREAAAVRDARPNAGGGIGNMFSPFSDFGLNPAGGIPGLDFNNLASISYTSSLDNIELNLRRTILMPPECLQMSLLVGGRYMTIDERFGYFTASDVPLGLGATNTVSTSTGNDMLGVQVGALFEFQVEPRWWADVEIKGVAFDNRASQATTYVNTINGFTATYPSARAEHRTTWALDLDLTLSSQVNSWLTFRIGYQALWIDGLALASENFQSDWDILTLGPPQLNHGGKMVFHGPHIGVTGAW